jgi:predicted TPR repeat methyltransferase
VHDDNEPPAQLGPAVPAVSAATLGVWLIQARDWQRQGNPGEAQALCRRILTVQPRHTEALNLLGMLLLQQGRLALAEQTIRQAIQSALGDATAYANLGATLAAQRRHEAAVAAFSHALRLRADDADVQIQLGDAYRELGQLAEAVMAWRQASLLRPADPDLHYRLGLALAEQGQAEEAIAALEITRQGNPNHLQAITLLATLLHRQGRIIDAGQVVGSAILDWGATAAAETLLRDWLMLTPDDPVAQHFLTAWFSQDIPPRAADAYVIRLFDQYADQFDEDLQGLQYRAPELIAEAIAATLGPPDGTLEILDAGCGTGLCAPLLWPYACHLTGVDLSPGMVDKARQRGDYDDLAVAELTAFLVERPAAYDLIASADTLVYFGELGPVLTAAAVALRPGGWLAFTVEAADAEVTPDGFCLNRSGRYSHTADYVRQMLTLAGLTLATLDRVTLRLEYDQPVAGWLVMAARPATHPDGEQAMP